MKHRTTTLSNMKYTVLICDADSQNYHDEDDKNLLYVACTRALHKLSLFCENEVSPLI